MWDAVHQQLMHKWVAHKRYAITCVRFTHDATAVYSCAEDCKVRAQPRAAVARPGGRTLAARDDSRASLLLVTM